MQLLEGQDVLALPLRLAGDGLNETLFLCSAQLDIGYDAARLTYLGTGETLAQTYGCQYTDPASGQEEPQTWVVNGQEPGTVRLAFASGFPCRTEEDVLTLYFALQESALPGDALIFSIQNAALTFADAKGQVISDTMLSTASGPLLLPSSPSAVPSVQTLQTVADRIGMYVELLGRGLERTAELQECGDGEQRRIIRACCCQASVDHADQFVTGVRVADQRTFGQGVVGA